MPPKRAGQQKGPYVDAFRCSLMIVYTKILTPHCITTNGLFYHPFAALPKPIIWPHDPQTWHHKTSLLCSAQQECSGKDPWKVNQTWTTKNKTATPLSFSIHSSSGLSSSHLYHCLVNYLWTLIGNLPKAPRPLISPHCCLESWTERPHRDSFFHFFGVRDFAPANTTKTLLPTAAFYTRRHRRVDSVSLIIVKVETVHCIHWALSSRV